MSELSIHRTLVVGHCSVVSLKKGQVRWWRIEMVRRGRAKEWQRRTEGLSERALKGEIRGM